MLPASEDYALPFETEGSDGGLMSFALRSLPLVESFRPAAIKQRHSGELMECLFEMFGASRSGFDGKGFAAALLNRRQSRIDFDTGPGLTQKHPGPWV